MRDGVGESMKDIEAVDGAGRSRWDYACRICGTPYRSKPEFCYDCGRGTVVPIEYVLD
jgi:rRNA maturation endonuclease Nob1